MRRVVRHVFTPTFLLLAIWLVGAGMAVLVAVWFRLVVALFQWPGFTSAEFWRTGAWVVLLVPVVPVLGGTFAIRSLRQVRRRLLGPAIACPCCGYDLRASPERCPECGAVRPDAKEAA